MAGSLVFAALLAVSLKIPRTEPGGAGGAAH
jgi:hypothetical protein